MKVIIIIIITCAQLISELYVSLHHRDGYKVLHLHFLPTTEEHQSVSVQRFELQLDAKVVVDVCERRISYERLFTVKHRSGH